MKIMKEYIQLLLEGTGNLEYVKNYLNLSDAEKGYEVGITVPEALKAYFELVGQNDLFVRLDNEEYEVVDDMPQEMLADFWKKVETGEINLGTYEAEQYWPAFMLMDYLGMLPETWLVHFTSAADDVACDGFQNGVSDPRQLALTTYIGDSERWDEEGYGFAFTANDYQRYARDRNGYKYGDEVVLFKASGVRVWHSSDQEQQIVFWGPDARDRVSIKSFNGSWTVPVEIENNTDPALEDLEDDDGFVAEVSFDDLDETIGWVIDNFEKYKDQLTC